MRRFAIRPTEAGDWPCPWVVYQEFREGHHSLGSWPDSWPLEAAKNWVDHSNGTGTDGTWAVFSVTPRGQKQTQVYPTHSSL